MRHPVRHPSQPAVPIDVTSLWSANQLVIELQWRTVAEQDWTVDLTLNLSAHDVQV